MNEREIAIKIEEKAKELAKALYNGNSVEIKKVNGNTLKFFEVKKKVIQ